MGSEGGGGGRGVGLLPLPSAADTPRPAVLGPVEGLLRSDRNKHIPPSPLSISQLRPWEPKGRVRVWKRFLRTPPPPHTGKRRAHRGPSPRPGGRLDKASQRPGPQRAPGRPARGQRRAQAQRLPWVSSDQDSALPVQRAWVQHPCWRSINKTPLSASGSSGRSTREAPRASRVILSQETLITP